VWKTKNQFRFGFKVKKLNHPKIDFRLDGFPTDSEYNPQFNQIAACFTAVI